jgi:poly-beta-1,6 N-acetyl-D-glucosamine synthase
MDITIFLIITSYLLLAVLTIRLVVFGALSALHYQTNKKRKRIRSRGRGKPFVSIIVPSYNEEKTLKNCVDSLMAQTYRKFEIILVNDGSADRTREVSRKLSARYQGRVFDFNKLNGGKASALNCGLRHARGEIIVSIDADSVFAKHTLNQLVRSFRSNPFLGAVGGNVKVANRSRFLNLHQAVEYIIGLNFQRRAFAFMGCMQVISGAIGAFKKDKLLAIGGYSSDTIVEDMDVTISMVKAGYKVEYNGKAIAYTEAPENLKDFSRQRYRWIFGRFQVLSKHRDMLFNKKYGLMGLVGIPYVYIAPWVDIIAMLQLLFLVYMVSFGGGGSVLIYIVITLILQILTLLYVIIMDNENKRLLLLFGVDSLWYYYLINIITLRVIWDYLYFLSRVTRR